MQLTIANEIFEIPARYAAGHTLNESEAAALNRLLLDTVRNNSARQIGTAKRRGRFDRAVWQAQLEVYARNYKFGVGRHLSLHSKEIMNIARDKIIEGFMAKFGTNPYTDKQITQLAKDLLAKPEGREWCFRRIEAKLKEGTLTATAAEEVLSDLGI